MLARGGMPILAVGFALAFAAISLANSVAQEVISVLVQTLDEGDGVTLQFTVAGTDVHYGFVLQSAIVVSFVTALLFAVWHLTRGITRTCPECRSEVPRQASICRYCTIELPAATE